MHLDGPTLRLRDYLPSDGERLGWLLGHERPWHQTNGPYFGLPTASQTSLNTEQMRLLAAKDHDSLPSPRTILGIEHRDSGELIGSVNWYYESAETDWRRMGLGIHDEGYWGLGLGTEALALWTSYLFESTDVLRMDFATYSGNPGMVTVGRNLGFIEEARIRQARRWSGGVHDSIVMGLLREEWEQVRGSWPQVKDRDR